MWDIEASSSEEPGICVEEGQLKETMSTISDIWEGSGT